MSHRRALATPADYRASLSSETDFDGWRDTARRACAARIAPINLQWKIAGRPEGLDLAHYADLPIAPQSQAMRIAKPLLRDIKTALLHSEPTRFDLAYRLVWRAQSEPKIHLNPADSDVKTLYGLAKSVRRDIHKMHAFVRFRKVSERAGREQFVAWFEPDHHITAAVAPFFRNRFAGMDWLIVTPECSIGWDGQALAYGPGGSRNDGPQEDSIEDEWRSYYASIFNPARVKVQAMKSEMPMKYWRNLPEAQLIPGLIEQAENRTSDMIDKPADPVLSDSRTDWTRSKEPADSPSLPALYDLLEQRDDAPIDHFSSTVVRGEGPQPADLMVVGEQPGDEEDRQDRMFVGPAGRMLDRALSEANIDREKIFLTNAVKRFKFIQRGKRRIHQTPSAAEVEYYRWWVDRERQLVRPKIVIALGSTAALSLTGQKITLARYRGKLFDLGENQRLLITVHPAFLLRIPDQAGQEIEYQKFLRDLTSARNASQAAR